MNEVTGRRRPSAAFLIKILIVLIFPLRGFFYSYETWWHSILLTVIDNQFIALNPINSLVAGILILLPCLIFEWQLNSRPISKSIRGRTAAACILSWVFSFILLPFANPYWGSDPFYNTMVYTPILAIAFFVILPLISRETTRQSISTEHRNLSYRFITSTLRKRSRREKILSGLLWFGLVFCPFMFFAVNYGWSYQIQLSSLFYFVSGYGGGLIYGFTALVNVEFQFAAAIAASLPPVALLAGLRFVFVRDVFRYQNGNITKSRLVSVALLGELLPSAALTLFALITFPPGMGFFPLFLPMPILPLLGFVFLRFSKFVPVKEELWTDYEHRMWFEKEQEPYVPKPVEETIKVPITYLLVSQVRKRLKE
ncbi:MAG: hypothetical protein KGD60_02985 [Candidatus Thorarchaeota archaeon]|nr:hypothetical protein [Candidatus Thorarchaeota archaeon]